MNNQPYFRYSHLDDVERHRAGESMEILKRALRELDTLDEENAVNALAAFIRSRTLAEIEYQRLLDTRIGSAADIVDLVAALESFLDPDAPSDDRPLRLQATVGGLVRASGASVSGQSLNDPSRHAPGDAHVPDPDHPRWVAEVKARPLDSDEAHAFVSRVCEYGGIEAAWIIAIHPDHDSLPRATLREHARRYGLLVLIAESVIEMVELLVGHPTARVPAAREASEAIAIHLGEMRAGGRTIQAWKNLFPT